MPLKQLPEVLPEPLTHEDINDWVDTAVGVGDHLSNLYGQIQLFALLAWIGEKDILEGRNKYSQIVGGPEEEEQKCDSKYEAHGFGLLLTGSSEQNADDPCVADDHHSQRQN